MSIFGEYSGPVGERGYYSAADWNKLQNPDWAKDQAEYDRFAAQAEARAESRAEAMSRAREAIPFSYTQFGRGGTEPVFSLAGYSGHTSGGTAGLAGFSGTGSPVGYSTSEGGTTSGGNTNPGDQNPGDRVDTQIRRAEGGVVPSIQYMQEGGMIQSPYADPMKKTYSALPMQMGPLKMITPEPIPTLSGPMPAPTVMDEQPMPAAPQQPAIGGLFQQLHQQFGQQMGQMQSQPLKVYQNYLMQTYAQPEMQAEQQKVDHFLDLVDQAERAHFGAEESFGFGGGPMAQQYQQALPAPRGGPMPGSGIMGGGIASLMGG
jgi:hypothetical protein